MSIRAECYAGYRGEQEPVAFWLGERRLAVRAVTDRWFSPMQRWFKVDAEDGNMYILRHDCNPHSMAAPAEPCRCRSDYARRPRCRR